MASKAYPNLYNVQSLRFSLPRDKKKSKKAATQIARWGLLATGLVYGFSRDAFLTSRYTKEQEKARKESLLQQAKDAFRQKKEKESGKSSGSLFLLGSRDHRDWPAIGTFDINAPHFDEAAFIKNLESPNTWSLCSLVNTLRVPMTNEVHACSLSCAPSWTAPPV